MFRNVALLIIAVIGVIPSAWAQAPTESVNFDVEPEGWTEFLNRDTLPGVDFGYSFTNDSEGVGEGEAGGNFPRIQTVAYYADTTLEDTLGYSSPLVATGKLFLDNHDADGRVDIGWFDKNDPPDKMDLIGISINNGVEVQAVARPTGGDDLEHSPNDEAGMRDGVYDFTLIYDGAGQLQITMADGLFPDRVAGFTIPDGTYELNAFGMTTSGDVGSDDPELFATVFIDDITYTTGVETPNPIAGDFNNNGVVDAADYVLWRDPDGGPLANEGGVTPGERTPGDYTHWRSRFGANTASGSALDASIIPEPASAAILGLSLLLGSVLILRWPRSRCQH